MAPSRFRSRFRRKHELRVKWTGTKETWCQICVLQPCLVKARYVLGRLSAALIPKKAPSLSLQPILPRLSTHFLARPSLLSPFSRALAHFFRLRADSSDCLQFVPNRKFNVISCTHPHFSYKNKTKTNRRKQKF